MARNIEATRLQCPYCGSFDLQTDRIAVKDTVRVQYFNCGACHKEIKRPTIFDGGVFRDDYIMALSSSNEIKGYLNRNYNGVCPYCFNEQIIKRGIRPNGKHRFYCQVCHKDVIPETKERLAGVSCC